MEHKVFVAKRGRWSAKDFLCCSLFYRSHHRRHYDDHDDDDNHDDHDDHDDHDHGL